MDYLIRTPQPHDWEHYKCTEHFLCWEHCNEISLVNFKCVCNVPGGFLVGTLSMSLWCTCSVPAWSTIPCPQWYLHWNCAWCTLETLSDFSMWVSCSANSKEYCDLLRKAEILGILKSRMLLQFMTKLQECGLRHSKRIIESCCMSIQQFFDPGGTSKDRVVHGLLDKISNCILGRCLCTQYCNEHCGCSPMVQTVDLWNGLALAWYDPCHGSSLGNGSFYFLLHST